MPRGLRPVPVHLRVRRGLRYRQYARFYGNYVSMIGKRKRFSFSVRVDPRMSRRDQYGCMVMTCNALKYQRMVPQHRQGQVFSSFDELLNETLWFRVRKFLNYKPGMVYER